MINLLPPEIKRKNLLEKRKTIVSANLILFLLFSVLLLSTVFSINFYLQIQTNRLKTQLANNEQTLERSENKEILDKIDLFNLSFEKLNAFYGQRIYISEILEKISQVFPDNVYLTNLSISPDAVLEDEGDGLKRLIGFKISIAGFSPTREEVIQLKENMEKEKSFKEVFFPLSNWVKSTDVSFSLSFKIVKP